MNKKLSRSLLLALALGATQTQIASAGVVGLGGYCSHYGTDRSGQLEAIQNGCVATRGQWDPEASSPFFASASTCSGAAAQAYAQAAERASEVCPQDEVSIYTSYQTTNSYSSQCRVNARYVCGPPGSADGARDFAQTKLDLVARGATAFIAREDGSCSARVERSLKSEVRTSMRRAANRSCYGVTGRMGFSSEESVFQLPGQCVVLGSFESGCTPGGIGEWDSEVWVIGPPPSVGAGMDPMSCIYDGSKWSCYVVAPMSNGANTNKWHYKEDLLSYNEVEVQNTVQEHLNAAL